jgi:hypothetical protein
MNARFSKRNQIALAVATAIGAGALATMPTVASAAKTPGKYVAGDFHNHTTCSDGSISMQKLVRKATGTAANGQPDGWGLDWFVQAGHGGNGNRNCTLVEDATLATPAYPYLTGPTPFNTAASPAISQYNGPQTTWAQSIGAGNLKGLNAASSGNMWRWQSLQEYQYQVMEYLSANKNVPLFLGLESVVAGHEHTSMSVITGQMPTGIDTVDTSGSTYTALGNASGLAQWSYCFDRGDTDTSRGVSNNWICSVTGSLNAADVSWNATAQKLIPVNPTGTPTNGFGGGIGIKGHNKTVEAVKWMAENHPNGSYYIPAHLERAGVFNVDGNNGFNVEHLRNFNNAAPNVAFGMETQPGHGASANRGEYQPNRNSFTTSATTTTLVDSVGGTTYGGTGVYGAQIGGVWDALLGEGRNFWFFASSDWHNRGSFGPDDRRSTQDFQPGEYQRNYTMVRNGTDKLRPQSIVDGLRTGNNFAASGQLIDRLAFVACASYPGITARSNAQVEALAVAAATNNTDVDSVNCASMGEKLKVRPGAEIVVSVVVRDPSGSNSSPYTFNNPSLTQISVAQPLNLPVLDHIDLIRGLVTGFKTPGAADYSGEWPRNTAWLATDGTTASLAVVPAAAKNTSAAIIKTFNSAAGGWVSAGTDMLKMTYRIPAVSASQYVRLRGSNLPAAVPFETDASGNPLSDLYTNAVSVTAGVASNTKLSIPCTVVGTTQFDGCPSHLPTAPAGSVIAGQKAVAFDVAAWADLWFYSNPIYVEVSGGTLVAGVK